MAENKLENSLKIAIGQSVNKCFEAVDITPENSEKWIEMEQLLRTVAANYNVKEMRTPIFEHTELFSRAVGDTTDVVTKEMYTFKDKGDRSLTLRPEGTSGIARAYVENKMYALPEKLQKVYYMGPMFRYERPQNGRQRQFHQFGVEALGVTGPNVDAEIILLAVQVLQSLGLKDLKLKINSCRLSSSLTSTSCARIAKAASTAIRCVFWTAKIRTVMSWARAHRAWRNACAMSARNTLRA